MKTAQRLAAPCLILILSVLMLAASAFAQGPDGDALKGVKDGKALFDINLAQAESVPLYLQVIAMTHQGLVAQGVTPEFVVAFRGPSVQFITGKAPAGTSAEDAVYKQIAVKIRELKGMGVTLEACAIATGLFHVENSTVLPEIKVVGNTFISLIGYQARGYGTIPIM